MAYDANKNLLVQIIDAASKRKDAENKFKSDLLKLQIQAVMRRMEHQQNMRDQMTMARAKDQSSNPQNYTPEQMYLRRRLMEESPMNRLIVPATDNTATQAYFPQDEVVYNPTSKMYEDQPLSQDRQASLYLAKIDSMLANPQGPQPNALALKIAQKMRERLNNRIDPQNKNDISSVQERLNYLDRQIAAGNDTNGSLKAESNALNDRLRGMMGYQAPEAQPQQNSGGGLAGWFQKIFSGGGSNQGASNEQQDPAIVQRVKELKSQYSDSDIAEFLRQKNIDPSKYGL